MPIDSYEAEYSPRNQRDHEPIADCRRRGTASVFLLYRLRTHLQNLPDISSKCYPASWLESSCRRDFTGGQSGLMVSKHIHAERRGSAGIGFVTQELGLGIKSCEVALSSASARIWDSKIKSAQRAHDIALRFMHRFKLSGHEAQRINQRIVHLRSLLDELK